MLAAVAFHSFTALSLFKTVWHFLSQYRHMPHLLISEILRNFVKSTPQSECRDAWLAFGSWSYCHHISPSETLDMRITYLGHAGFIVETDDSIVIIGSMVVAHRRVRCGLVPGCLVIITKLRLFMRSCANSRRSIFLHISHEHQDHFDIKFLNTPAGSEVHAIGS